MILRLILTRHAKSDWSKPGQDDFDRPLNPRGRRDAPRVGEWLASRGYRPDHVLCSAAIRTRETTDLLLSTLGAQPEIRYRAGLYHADADTMLTELRAGGGTTLLMVGHNPGIAEFARLLVHDRPPHPRFADYPTAATAVIDFALPGWGEVGPGLGALRDFVTPDDL